MRLFSLFTDGIVNVHSCNEFLNCSCILNIHLGVCINVCTSLAESNLKACGILLDSGCILNVYLAVAVRITQEALIGSCFVRGCLVGSSLVVGGGQILLKCCENLIKLCLLLTNSYIFV